MFFARYLHLATAGKPTIVHRDIKPENVLLKDGAARLGDVGIAREMATTYARTMVQGIFQFLDPEYESSQRLTTASDVYSAGIVVFQLLAGADTAVLHEAYSLTDGLPPEERWPRRWEAQQRTRHRWVLIHRSEVDVGFFPSFVWIVQDVEGLGSLLKRDQ